MCKAIKNGDLDEVKRLLEDGVDPNCVSPDWNKSRPIILAAVGGQTSMMKLLLEQSSLDPNVCDELFGNTALIDASHAGNTDVVRLLLDDHRVDVNLRSKGSGRTALMQAARYGNANIVRMLVEKNPDGVNLKSNGGRTPLMFGCLAPNKAVLNDPQMFRDMLKVKGIDLSIQDNHGKTALDWARDKELFSVEKLMLKITDKSKCLEEDRIENLESLVKELQAKLIKAETINKDLQENIVELNEKIKDQEFTIKSLSN